MSIEGDFTKTKELTEEQIESLLEIKPGPNDSLQDLILYLKDLDPITSNKCIRFVVSKDYEIFLSREIHNVLSKRLGGDRQAFLVPDGQIQYKTDKKEIYFRYTWSDFSKNRYLLQTVVQSKILDFLKSEGIEINRVLN